MLALMYTRPSVDEVVRTRMHAHARRWRLADHAALACWAGAMAIQAYTS